MIRVQWPKVVDMQQKIMKLLKLPLEFKAYWSFRSDDKWRNVICLETYKNVKTMHCCKTGINWHWFLDFANTRILTKTCPALRW